MKGTGLSILALAAALSVPAWGQADLSGSWQQQGMDYRSMEPALGDFTGLPINDAARLRGEAFSAELWAVPEHQCKPHPIDYATYGPANLRIWNDIDPVTLETVATHMTLHWMISQRTIWMDGRPHPSPYALHTWMGFSTGRWQGDTLVVSTTHLKEGWLRRNGVPRSESARLTEYWTRNDNYLTAVMVLDDPDYMTGSLVRSMNWVNNPGYAHAPYPCSARIETILPPGYVAHFLPGRNEVMDEQRASLGIPLEAMRGGAVTTTPEFARELAELAKKRRAADQPRENVR